MSYQLGAYRLPRGKDFVGRRAIVLDRIEIRGRTLFEEGVEGEIRRVWKGKAPISRDSEGGAHIRASGVDGWKLRLLPPRPPVAE